MEAAVDSGPGMRAAALAAPATFRFCWVNAFLKFSLDGLLRADVEARNRSYATGLQAGYYTVNDVLPALD
jgi:hypothetical protein